MRTALQPLQAAGAHSFVDLLPMALWSAAYPTLLAMVVFLLGRSHARRLLITYYLGGLTISLITGAAVIEVFKGGRSLGAPDSGVGPGIDLAAGLLALVLFWILLTRRDHGLRELRSRQKRTHDAHDPWSKRLLERESPGLTFAIALVLNLPGAMYLVALKDIAQSNADTGQIVLWVVLYNLIMFAVIEFPIVAYVASPETTRRRVGTVNAWLGAHGRQIAMGLCVTGGTFLVTRGAIAAL